MCLTGRFRYSTFNKKSFSKHFFLFLSYLSVEMVCMFECRYHPRLEESVRSLRTGVPDRNEARDTVAGNGI